MIRMSHNIENAVEDFTSNVDDRIDDLIALTEKSDDELNIQHLNPKSVCGDLINGVGMAIERLIDAQSRLDAIMSNIERINEETYGVDDNE